MYPIKVSQSTSSHIDHTRELLIIMKFSWISIFIHLLSLSDIDTARVNFMFLDEMMRYRLDQRNGKDIEALINDA